MDIRASADKKAVAIFVPGLRTWQGSRRPGTEISSRVGRLLRGAADSAFFMGLVSHDFFYAANHQLVNSNQSVNYRRGHQWLSWNFHAS